MASNTSSKKPKPSKKSGFMVNVKGVWSEDLGDKIIEMLEGGYTQTMVREELNISASSWKTWMYKRREKGGRPGFKERVHAARKAAQQNMLDLVQMHAQKDWRAAAWYLERTASEFKLKVSRSKEAQAEIDAAYVAKAQAECDLVRAKTKALQKNLMTPEELLDVLKDAREIRSGGSKDAVH